MTVFSKSLWHLKLKLLNFLMDSVLQYFFRNFFGCLTLSSLTRRLPIYNSFFHWCFIFPFQTMCGVLAQIELFRRPVHVHMYTYRFMKTEANSFKNIVWSESIPICAFVSQKRSEQEKTKDGCGMGEWWKTTNIAFLPFFLPSYAFFFSLRPHVRTTHHYHWTPETG